MIHVGVIPEKNSKNAMEHNNKPSILKASHLTKRFGSFVAVDDISFELGEGEIMGLLGVNGAGKTTTIQMLLGILSETHGSIEYFGKSFKKYRGEILEKVNFSSTYTSLPYNLLVKECLKFISYLYDIPNPKQRINKMVELFRLEKLLSQKISNLSAGQLTRVNLAKALINSPKILLLDEPTASLDPEVASYIREFLLEEREKSGISIILTSHNMAEIEEVCDRVVFIHNGKIIADDTPSKLAQSINTAKIELYLPEKENKVLEHCLIKGLICKANRGRVIVEVEEALIADFLQGLAVSGITYDEISIEKPTLQDYFLKVAKITSTQYHED
ncbi:MAG: hypothetical protein A3B86_03345 [Candidatus Yanofskybacteria bacterium RIFCSPHIGHO2_02_FULL_38_22b]|uniref:ABC transporter domain-containing protein n=1 Tax=Candidatus Yanofskybacteria bacterium RIFCSPHIGHO2_02_FULL_38_22b TaxID=1802673 RepID=A0A1F8F2P4_9BACT|nr:MAG: hypothetical protein A3B86_03345 [Candidatus Yanofskybacteria bacterium RIFCSPHIGHO2_02_FULL_38_22b]OGN19883.1 MAG: hypothetical protein A2910_01920 [Candidatus Yanofskybacteria bacterium RIFCSPLOWO2_01_FULL_39_28]